MVEYLSETAMEDSCREAARGIFPDDETKSIEFLQTTLIDLQTSVPSRIHEGVRYYPKDEAVYFLENWIQAYQNNDASYLIAPRGLKRQIASIEEFACSGEYLGLGSSIRYRILQELIRLHANQFFIEVVLGGGIGIGKNFFADISIPYEVYKLSCYESPQLELGMAPGSPIVIILQSVTEKLAKKVIFKDMKDKILRSPYFQKHFPPDPKIKTELVFPNNITIMPVSANDTAALGSNVLIGMMDEVNFHPRRQKSPMTELRGDSEYDKATVLYQTLRRRMMSRFMRRQNFPGRLYLVASANYPGDFVSRKIEESKEDPTIFVMNMPQWEAHRLRNGTLDPDRYSGEMFTLDLGNAQVPARILKEGEEPDDAKNTLEIPVEHRKEFEDNVDDALRDIAGMPRSKKTMFMPSPGVIRVAHRTYDRITGRRHTQLFNQNMVDLSLFRDNELKDLVNTVHISTCVRKWKEYGFQNPPLFGCHIDAGLTKDNCGIAVSRVYGVSSVNALRSYMPSTDKMIEFGHGLQAPVIFTDGLLGITPPPGDEIDLTKVMGIVFILIKMGVDIRWVSMDRFASPQMLQIIRSKYKNIRTQLISVDSPLTAYFNYKTAIREYRVIHPYHPIQFRELKELELDKRKNERGKVEHPAMSLTGVPGSKDLADCECGVYKLLSGLKETYRYASFENSVNQYELAGLENPDLNEPDIADDEAEEESQDIVIDSRSNRNPNRPRRGVTRQERLLRFRGRIV